MRKTITYEEKFARFPDLPLFHKLEAARQAWIKEIASTYRLTFQEFKQVVEAERDLAMWGEPGLESLWTPHATISPDPRVKTLHATSLHREGKEKNEMLTRLREYMDQLRHAEKSYPQTVQPDRPPRSTSKVVSQKSDKNIQGMCPVASDKTVCCNLHTIDAVENCVFGCSYCSIQTFYEQDTVIQEDIAAKLAKIEIDPKRFYHFGTGQSSDSLAWGNRNDIIAANCRFAARHPNILMEFKTKSDNIAWFLENAVPVNVVCTWSLNPQTIIDNEEHFTASLDQRIAAARAVADKGVKVGFHFHPIVYFKDWEKEYGQIVERLVKTFKPTEVLFVSFGSVTLIKPVIKKIRDLGHPTKILQMPLVKDPHGKLTYPDETKVKIFRFMYEAFQPWRERVFFYLCMEKADIWEQSFGYVYDSNAAFEVDFGAKTMGKFR